MFSRMNKIYGKVIQTRCFSDMPIGIIGVPLSKGTGKVSSGLQKGPSALRERGLLQELTNIGLDVKDYGDLEFNDTKEEIVFGKSKFPSGVSEACKKLSDTVKSILEDNRRCLTIGGDHSLGMGTVHGHSRFSSELCVLWVDAHVDINTEFTTPSGNIHGMPCSFFIKELQKYRKDSSVFSWLEPCLSAKNIAYIGCHDIDPMEKLLLKQENITHFTMSDIDRLGVIEVTNRALDIINPSGKLPLHVSFDIDSLDKTLVPSTTVPCYGGLTVREVLCLTEEICKRGVPRAVDIVEIDPSKGSEDEVNKTLDIALLLIKAFLGHPRCGALPKQHKIPMQ